MLKEVRMNKIRRVIWSGTRNCFVVVSELVKGHVKRSHRTTKSQGTVALLCATLLCSGVTSYVGAADETVGTGNGVAYGTGSVATDATSTAVGSGAQANAGNAVAIGKSAKAKGTASTAVGNGAQANAETSSAFGNSSVAKGPGSIALGASSSASSEGSVALGRTSSADGKSSISIGDNARVVSNGYSLTSIAMGKNAYVLNGTGQQEYEFSFNKDSWNKTGFFRYKYDPKAGTDALDRLAGGIAIGTNAYARTGSVEIGGHTMQGKIMGGTTVDGSSANIIDMTTIGTNSYNKGMMATIVGAYSINTGDFDGSGGLNSFFYGSQNMGSVLVGSLNQNRSKGKDGSSGIANAIVGVANIAENANGALIYGAGNKITNSIASISGFDANSGVDTVDKIQQNLTDAVRSSKGGGATMAFGGGNVADYTNLTMITGVNNTVKGTADNIIKLDSIIGYNNAVTGASDIKLIGNSNTIEEKASNNIIFGDNYTLKSGKTNNVILGSAEKNRELAVSNATILGYNANVQADGGVALGFGSIASIAAGVAGYNPKGDSPDDATWKSTWAAVSVGDGTNTRQITGVAAGTNDTDAVNVAQLKKVAESAGGSGNLIAGDGIKLVKGSDGSWTISTNFTNSGSDNVSYKEVTDTTSTTSTTSTTTTTDGNTTTDNTGISGTNVGTSGTDTAADTTTTQQGKAAVIETTLTADDGNSTTISESGKLGVKGDDSNIITSVSGSDVKVSLHKDISVNSVTVNDGPTINSTGIDMNGKKISNLADGDIYEGSHDAVTGGQLWNVEQGMNNQVRHLDKKINRVGAGAAALAALHPLDFDADDKWNIAAGVGAYKGTSAMALGAFYRPNEVTQLSIGGAFGNGENMWNMGISWRTGSGESYSGKSKAELVRMVNAMEARDAQQDAIIKQQQVDIQKQQEGLAKQEAEINELKAMVQRLLAK